RQGFLLDEVRAIAEHELDLPDGSPLDHRVEAGAILEIVGKRRWKGNVDVAPCGERRRVLEVDLEMDAILPGRSGNGLRVRQVPGNPVEVIAVLRRGDCGTRHEERADDRGAHD